MGLLPLFTSIFATAATLYFVTIYINCLACHNGAKKGVGGHFMLPIVAIL